MADSLLNNYNKKSSLSESGGEKADFYSDSLLSQVDSGLAFFKLSERNSRLNGQDASALSILGENLDKQFRAASTIKIPIVAALFYEAMHKRLNLADLVAISEADIVEGGILCEVGVGRHFSWRELARLAIVISDNSASNLIIKKLGFTFINSFIKDILQAHHTVLNRYFMASPQEMGENYTTARDLALIMASLWQGRILDKSYNDEFWAILSRQQFIEKLPSRILGQVKSYNKTGELDDGARHDAAVFTYKSHAWGLVALTDQQKLPAWQIDWAMGAWSELIFHSLHQKAEGNRAFS
ncbi:TPA: hypothetical protein DD394_07950 [bacterium UBP9_UBA11836]|nr:hypothetical protein [bacterium UBP9_UBA11836]